MYFNKTMTYLAQGDLQRARQTIRDASAAAPPAVVAPYFANFFDLYWALPDDLQKLVLQLAPAAFDDRAAWAIVFTQTYDLRGDKARARIYADSARLAFEDRLRALPDDPQNNVLHGLALAYLGRKAEAIAAGEKGVALLPISSDAFTGPYFQHQLVRIYLLVGEPMKALDRLEPLLTIPYYLSPGWLRIDPTFDSIRENPRFKRLVN
jgi:tetratricopeptide (TPR) repeat protein